MGALSLLADDWLVDEVVALVSGGRALGAVCGGGLSYVAPGDVSPSVSYKHGMWEGDIKLGSSS